MTSMTPFQSNLFNLVASRPISPSTQSELIGLTSKSLNRYMFGQTEPSLTSLIQLALFYDVSLDSLVGLESYKSRNARA